MYIVGYMTWLSVISYRRRGAVFKVSAFQLVHLSIFVLSNRTEILKIVFADFLLCAERCEECKECRNESLAVKIGPGIKQTFG